MCVHTCGGTLIGGGYLRMVHVTQPTEGARFAGNDSWLIPKIMLFALADVEANYFIVRA